MGDKTIERIEEKYLISESEKSALLKVSKKFLEKDEYYKEEVLSIYFDTDDYELAIRSIDRPEFRYKVRIRSYNVPKLSSPIFFEIKSKLNNGKKKIGTKRRLVIPLKDFYDYVEKGKKIEDLTSDTQIARELDYLMKFKHLGPKVFVAADRTAFVGKEDKGFRLTFDENLRFRDKKLRLEKGSSGEKYFPLSENPNKNVIMEVKTMNAMPPWFVKELSHLKIYPARFSKYGKIYQLLKERKENV